MKEGTLPVPAYRSCTWSDSAVSASRILSLYSGCPGLGGGGNNWHNPKRASKEFYEDFPRKSYLSNVRNWCPSIDQL
jgi:hypothetical protein